MIPATPEPKHAARRVPWRGRAARSAVWSAAWLVTLGWTTWTFGALYFDFPVWKTAAAWAFALGTLTALVLVPRAWGKLAVVLAMCGLVTIWWRTLQPTNDANWQPGVARLAWADIHGDEVTLHNVRNSDYRAATDYTPRWETRAVRLSQITGADLAVNYWGSPWIAHPIVSFQFADALPICFSIETRVKNGQGYSPIAGLYRRYELIYTVADERDVIRLRTNYRMENIYLYRTSMTPAQARELFLEYLHALNSLRDRPRWYNQITANCTTSIRASRSASERSRLDWRMLLNGKADEMMFERRTILSDGLPFAELKNRALIDKAAQAADDSPDFSRLIREGRPGFSPAGQAQLDSAITTDR